MARVVLYTDATEIGGAEVSLARLIEHLGPGAEPVLAGVDEAVVTWIGAHRPGMETNVLQPVSRKWDLPAVRRHVRGLGGLRPQVLQLNLRQPWSCQYALVAGWLLPVPVVALQHSSLDAHNASQRALVRALARRISAHVAVSHHLAAQVERLWRLPAGRVRVIYPDPGAASGRPGDRNPGAGPSGLQRAGPTIAAVGRLSREKGFDLAVQAVANVPGARLVIIGEGPERAHLEGLVASLGLQDRVALPGWRERPFESACAFDVAVVPSRLESFGLTAVEAMLAGLPVVATRAGGLPEVIVDGRTGVLVDPEDVEQLASAVAGLLSDPRRRVEMAAAARADVEHRFTPGSMARAFEALYAALLA
ncbi:MAG: glycosyltransferase [Acidimicrobiales bacterium]